MRASFGLHRGWLFLRPSLATCVPSKSSAACMFVIISVRRLDNDRIEVGVARLQHDSNPTHNYPSEKEARAVLFGFWDLATTRATKASERSLLGGDAVT